MDKYKPKYSKSKSWLEIENWYVELIEHGFKFEPILRLIQYIRNSNLNQRLYAFTSMHKVVIGIYDEIE